MLAEEGGPTPAPHRDELIRVMDANGFAAMCEVANHCPACILSALRTKNGLDPETGPYVAGPADGREAWDYKQSKEVWWSDFSDRRQEHESPY